jgi:hypothetical protein
MKENNHSTNISLCNLKDIIYEEANEKGVSINRYIYDLIEKHLYEKKKISEIKGLKTYRYLKRNGNNVHVSSNINPLDKGLCSDN